jgi:hypothetical protein
VCVALKVDATTPRPSRSNRYHSSTSGSAYGSNQPAKKRAIASRPSNRPSGATSTASSV